MIWFCLVQLIIVLIMLNMLLAIIMESYMTVKSGSSKAVSLIKQIQDMKRRRQMNMKGERVKLNKIYETFKALSGEEEMLASKRMITAEMLQKVVPACPASQACRTIEGAWSEHLKRLEGTFDLPAMLPMARGLEEQSRKVQDMLFDVAKRTAFYDTINSSNQIPCDLKDAGEDIVEAPLPEELISEDMFEEVWSQVGRLRNEVACVLAKGLRKIDRRQDRIEQRQGDMLSGLHMMCQTLQSLQSAAGTLNLHVQHTLREQQELNPNGSTWRQKIDAGGVLLADYMQP